MLNNHAKTPQLPTWCNNNKIQDLASVIGNALFMHLKQTIGNPHQKATRDTAAAIVLMTDCRIPMFSLHLPTPILTPVS